MSDEDAQIRISIAGVVQTRVGAQLELAQRWNEQIVKWPNQLSCTPTEPLAKFSTVSMFLIKWKISTTVSQIRLFGTLELTIPTLMELLSARVSNLEFLNLHRVKWDLD